MKPALFGLFANSIAFSDLRWTSNKGLSLGRIRIELLSGLAVALALVPNAVAFAFVARVHPLVGFMQHFWSDLSLRSLVDARAYLGGHRSFGGCYGGFGG